MKIHKITVMFAILLSVGATQVFAEDSAPRTPNVNADTNGDGFIYADEKKAQKDKMHEMREKRKQSELN